MSIAFNQTHPDRFYSILYIDNLYSYYYRNRKRTIVRDHASLVDMRAFQIHSKLPSAAYFSIYLLVRGVLDFFRIDRVARRVFQDPNILVRWSTDPVLYTACVLIVSFCGR